MYVVLSDFSHLLSVRVEDKEIAHRLRKLRMDFESDAFGRRNLLQQGIHMCCGRAGERCHVHDSLQQP